MVVSSSGLNGKYRFAFEGTISASGTGGVMIVYLSIIRDRSSVLTTIGQINLGAIAGNSYDVSLQTIPYDIIAGDKVYLNMYYRPLFTSGNATNTSITFASGFALYSNPETTYQEGQTIDIVSALPEKTKQTEFIQYLIKAFNLYVEVDKIDPKKLIIEPRDEFYLDTLVDLTEYLDVSQELEIKPMGLLDFRVFEMSYKSDSDEFNKRYEDVYREPFSKQKFTINNDFVRDTKSIEIGFSASPLADSTTNDRVLTKIRPQDPSTDASQLPVYNIRLLQYGGLVDTTQGWNLYYNATATQNYTQFPYAGMLDTITAPTFSLECTLAKAYFYGSKPDTTTANLYNSYWLKTISEITDKDSKLVSGYFHLSPNQLANLSFRITTVLTNNTTDCTT